MRDDRAYVEIMKNRSTLSWLRYGDELHCLITEGMM